jgi:hypothetical protein
MCDVGHTGHVFRSFTAGSILESHRKTVQNGKAKMNGTQPHGSTARHSAPGKHANLRAAIEITTRAKPVWRTPADGPQHLDNTSAEHLMFGWHTENIHDQGCCPGHDGWRRCETFAAARVRGMHHTMFVVPMPYDPGHSVHQLWAVLDDPDDVSGYELREGFDGYHTALMFAAARCAVDLATETGR